MLNTEILQADLESEFLRLLEGNPLDDVLDALELAFFRHATDVRSDESDSFRSVAAEIRDLRNRDFEPCTGAVDEIVLPEVEDITFEPLIEH